MAERMNFKSNNFEYKTLQSFRRLRHETSYADVTLVSDDMRKVSAHRVILSENSEYFKTILSPDSGKLMICLEGTTHEDLNNVLDFIYNGEVTIQQYNMPRFLAIAERLKLDGMLGNGPYIKQEMDFDFIKEKYEDKKNLNLSIMEDEFEEQEDINNTSSDMGKPKSKKTMKKPQKKMDTSLDVSLEEKEQESAEKKEVKLDQSFRASEVTFESDEFSSLEELDRRKEMLIIPETDRDWYTCNVCDKGFNKLHHVREHVEIHIGGLRFKCNFCGRVKKSRTTFRQHKCQ